MNYKGRQCIIEEWATDGADIQASAEDTADVITTFHEVLRKRLTKKGLLATSEAANVEIIVRGRFVRIDQGNSLLRCLITVLGMAVIEVEGELMINGKQVAELPSTKRTGHGGNNGALRWCAKTCAKDVASYIIYSLEKFNNTSVSTDAN